MRTIFLDFKGWKKRIDISDTQFERGIIQSSFIDIVSPSIEISAEIIEPEPVPIYTFIRTGTQIFNIPIFKVKI